MRPDDGRVVSNFLVPGAAGQAAHDLRRRHARPAASATSTTRSAGFLALLDGDVTGPVNIGNPDEFTMLELAEMVLEVTGSASEIVLRAAAGRRPDAAPARHHPGARSALGWEPTIELREGLERTAELVPPDPRLTGRSRPLSGRGRGLRRGGRGTSRPCGAGPRSNGTSASNPKLLGRPAGVDPAPGLAVGLGGVPADLARRTRWLGDELDQVADRQLLVGAEVDRLGAVVALGREHDALGGVVDVEELAAAPTRCPTPRCGRRPASMASTHFLIGPGSRG